MDLLHRTNIAHAKPTSTLLPPGCKLSLDMGAPLVDPTHYHATLGSLQYLSLTRPDVCFAVNKLSQFMHQPTDVHWKLVKRLLCYLLGTIHHCLLLYRHSPCSVHAFSDADWGGNKEDLSSTSAYVIYLGRNPISWSSKKQQTTARSSTEAEYRAVADTAAEISWVCSLLFELHFLVSHTLVIYCDNIGATQLSSNPMFHSRMNTRCYWFSFHSTKGSIRCSTSVPCLFKRSASWCADEIPSPLAVLGS